MPALLEKTNQVVTLTTPPLVRGGEAAIHELPDHPDFIAKVYHQPTPAHAAKLAAMLAKVPADPMAGSAAPSIAWPLERLVSADAERRFVGYVMPRVSDARPIFEFYNPRARLQLCPQFHYGYLLRTARNLAAAVRAIHERGYVIGDLNETNTLVSNQALVTLVDTDSFQVPDDGCIYRCPVGKPEYTPPELQGVRFADFDRGPEHDAFALAVLIFQLLLQGVHPYAGRFVGEGEPGELAQRIATGQWPYARSRPVPYRPPPTAPPFETLPAALQDLMRCCFERGHARSTLRPTAAQWQQALEEAEHNLTDCPDNPLHFAHPELRVCPWCELAHRLGRDPFPAPLDWAGPPAYRRIGSRRTSCRTAARDEGATLVGGRPPPRPHNAPLTFPVPPPSRRPRQPRAPLLRLPAARVPARPRHVSFLGRWLGITLLLVVLLTMAGWLAVSRGAIDLGPVEARLFGSTLAARREFPLGELRQFRGHTNTVEGVAVSPDGRVAASAGADNSVRLWELDSGRELHQLEGHTNAVQVVAFAPDGRRLLSGGQDLTIRLWDVTAGRELRRLEGHTGAVHGLAFFPDGRHALSGSSDTTVRMWDLGRERELGCFTGHSSAVLAVAVSADGRRALSASADRSIILWDLNKKRLLRRFLGHGDFVRSVAFSPDGQLALSGGDDQTVRLWDLENGLELKRFTGHADWVFAVAFAPDGRRAVSAGKDHTLRLWGLPMPPSAPTLERPVGELHRFEVPDGECRSVAFCPDGQCILSGGEDNALRLWSAGK